MRPPAHDGFRHEAVLYGSDADLVTQVAPFLDGHAAGDALVLGLTPAQHRVLGPLVADEPGVRLLEPSHYGHPVGAARRSVELFGRLVDEGAARVRVIGAVPADPETWLLGRRTRKAARLGLDVDDVERKVALRDEARAKKDWKEADRLRAELSSIGVLVRDGVDRSTWTL